MSTETLPTSPSVTVEVPATPPVKPGYKTTEFWLAAVASLGGLVMASGAVGEESTIGKVVGLILTGLATMGYTASRSAVKKAV